MLDEFSLDVNSVEEHWSESDDNHFLVYLMNLSERLQDSWNDLVLDNLLLTILLHTQIRNGSYNIAEYFFLFLVIQQIKKDLQKSLFAEMSQYLWILRKIAHKFYHEPYKFISFFFVYGICQTIFNCRDFWLMNKMPMELWLTSHIA